MAFFHIEVEMNPEAQERVLKEARRDAVIGMLRIMRRKYANHSDFVLEFEEVFVFYGINPQILLWL